MDLKNISLPEVYKSSADFRFFIKWFAECLSKVQYDTEDFLDLFDPLRCPEKLLWLLADTMGFKYDERLSAAFNRLVLIYFMSMIRHKGSKDGVTLAAEVNLSQFRIDVDAGAYTDEDGNKHYANDILYNRLENTSIPVNSAYVEPHVDEGYIDVVYFSTRLPVDACIEYVRPLGMYLFPHAGVRFDTKTKISIDARLTNTNDIGVSIGPTHVGHYSRNDYARMQRMLDEHRETATDDNLNQNIINNRDTRQAVYRRNKKAEQAPDTTIDPGYRTLYSLQLCNNENIIMGLLEHPIFSVGYGALETNITYPDNYVMSDGFRYTPTEYQNPNKYKPRNLGYDKDAETELGKDVYTTESEKDILNISPAVNPVMFKVGDAMSMTDDNSKYTKMDKNNALSIVDASDPNINKNPNE